MFVATSEDAASPKKVKRALVMYHTPRKGKVQTWLVWQKEILSDDPEVEVSYDEVCTSNHKNYEQDFFTGENANVLAVATQIYQTELSALNPGVTFNIE